MHRAPSGLLLIFFLICSLGPVRAAGAENKNIQGLVDMAGSQRMLTQRMLRDYALVGLKVKYRNPGQDLSDIVNRFETQLQQLLSNPVNAEVTASFAEVQKLWEPVKELVKKTPQADSALELKNKLEELLKKSNEATKLIADASGSKLGEVVNTSGRQRMLSQRMAALYMLASWGIQGEDFFTQFRKVVDEYKIAHNFLLVSDKTTPEIMKKLKHAAKSFRWFDKALNKQGKRLTPEVVQRNSDIILKTMNEVTLLYASE